MVLEKLHPLWGVVLQKVHPFGVWSLRRSTPNLDHSPSLPTVPFACQCSQLGKGFRRPRETFLEMNRCVLFIFRPRDTSPVWISGCRTPTGPPFLLVLAQPRHLPITRTDPGLSHKPGSFEGVPVTRATLDTNLRPLSTPRSSLPLRSSAATLGLRLKHEPRLSCFPSSSCCLSLDSVCCDCPAALTMAIALGNTSFIYEINILASFHNQAGHLIGLESPSPHPLLPGLKS